MSLCTSTYTEAYQPANPKSITFLCVRQVLGGYLCFRVPPTAGTVQPLWPQSQFSQGTISKSCGFRSHRHRRYCLSFHRVRAESRCAPPQDLCQEREESSFTSLPGALFSSCCSSSDLGWSWPDLTLPGKCSTASQTNI